MAIDAALQERVLRDLRPFCDPGSTVESMDAPRGSLIQWESRGERREATFIPREDGLRVLFKDQEMPYIAFLSSPELGDLLYLARMMVQAAPASFFVPTRAELAQEGPEPQPPIATELIHRLLQVHDSATTNIVFIVGDAGAGKTHVLRELVKQQAARYRRGETARLYLYVNAQGRALAKVDEAFAVELDDLRARLNYSAIAPLVRNGLIVPIIDGFDELVGTTGYDDAFESLRRFLDDLEGEGDLVASARSVYYEQEFLRRATAAAALAPQQWTVVPVAILPWGEEDFNTFLDERYRFGGVQIDRQEFITRMRDVFKSPMNQVLLGKPLFVSKTAELILSGKPVSTGGSLLEELVSGYIERERTEKLLFQGQPICTRAQIESLLAFVAEEMWVQETRELDARSVREVAEVVIGQENLPARVRHIVVQRMPSLAMLMPLRGGERVTFEHEIFFGYCLADHICEALKGTTGRLHATLSRGRFPPATADVVASRFVETAVEEVVSRVVIAGEMESNRAAQVRENAGAIVGAIFRKRATGEQSATDIMVRKSMFAGVSLVGVKLRRCSFRECEFRQTDFSGAELRECDAFDVRMYEVIVDPESTRLEIQGIELARDVSGLQVRADGGSETVYNPERIRSILKRCGMLGMEEEGQAQSRKVLPEQLELLETAMEAFKYGSTVWPTDDKHRRWAVRPEWPLLQRMMVEAGVMESIVKQQKGSKRIGLRLRFRPGQVLAGLTVGAKVSDSILQLWTALEREEQRRQRE